MVLRPSSLDVSSTAQAEWLLLERYGIRGTAKRLAGEKDHNFAVTQNGRARYVLKISHPDEDIAVVRFQCDALQHVAKEDPELKVPLVVPTLDGAFECYTQGRAGPGRIVRLLTFIEGAMLHETIPSSRQDRALGAFLSRLGLALHNFRTADPRASHLWDLKHLPSSRDLIAHLSDPQSRSHVATAYDDFERHVAAQLPSLRAQAIHNDMNPWNVVVDPVDPAVVAGVIDFGDMAHGPLVCDAAVGAAYRCSSDEYPLAGAGRFLRGYADICPLEHEEVDIMLDLIRGRLAMIINIGNWQALLEPENSGYALRLQAQVTQTLDRLLRVSRDEGRRLMHEAVEGAGHG